MLCLWGFFWCYKFIIHFQLQLSSIITNLTPYKRAKEIIYCPKFMSLELLWVLTSLTVLYICIKRKNMVMIKKNVNTDYTDTTACCRIVDFICVWFRWVCEIGDCNAQQQYHTIVWCLSLEVLHSTLNWKRSLLHPLKLNMLKSFLFSLVWKRICFLQSNLDNLTY